MAGNISDYLELKLLDHSLGTAAYTMPTTVYVALYTSDPTDADSGDEVTSVGTAYARQAVTFAAAASGTTDNEETVTFPEATAAYGTVSYVGLRDADTLGNLLWHGPLTTAKHIDSGDQFRIKAGDLDVTLG